MSQIYKIFIAAFLIFNVFIGKAFSFSGEVTDISGREYYPAVKEAIDQAGESILMVMYLVAVDERNTKSSVYQLSQSLINAYKRGVAVTVILDASMDYDRAKEGETWQTEDKNANAVRLFKENGIDVSYDETTTLSHNKVIVIDRKIVIVGSTNWSEYALDRNNESSVLIRSPELAEHYLEQLGKIQLDKQAQHEEDAQEAPLVLDRILIESPNFLSRMMTASDERAFDVYLLLLKEFKGNSELIFDYDSMAERLSLNKKMNAEAYRRQLNKTLRKLMDRYRLMRFEPQWGKDAKVRLLDPENPEKGYAYPQGNYFTLPGEYFAYGWCQRLLLKEKFCYLINLVKANVSPEDPWWFGAQTTLEKQFHVQKETLQLGMIGLRRWNLIDLEYSSIDGGYDNREPTRYRILAPYSYEQLKAYKQRLIEKFGKQRFDQAVKWAKIVLEENDPAILEDILHLTDEYGQEKMEKAFQIVAKKELDNPKRTYKYVVGVLQGGAN